MTVATYTNCTLYQTGTTYLTYCTEGEGGGGGGVGNPPGGGGGDDGDEQIPVDTLNKLTDTCLKKAIKMALDTGIKNDFKSIMQNTILYNANIILIFQEANLNDTTLMGSFTPWVTKQKNNQYYQEATIKFNTQTIPQASQEMAIWTFYHEVLHSYLDKIGGLMQPSYSHEYMATTYVSKMATALQKIFPAMFNSDASALGWAGLQGTPMWSLKSTAQQ